MLSAHTEDSETETLTSLCQMPVKQMVIYCYPSLIPRPQDTKLEVWNETTATLAQAHSQTFTTTATLAQ